MAIAVAASDAILRLARYDRAASSSDEKLSFLSASMSSTAVEPTATRPNRELVPPISPTSARAAISRFRSCERMHTHPRPGRTDCVALALATSAGSLEGSPRGGSDDTEKQPRHDPARYPEIFDRGFAGAVRWACSGTRCRADQDRGDLYGAGRA